MSELHIRMLPAFAQFFKDKAGIRTKVLYGGSSSGKTYAAIQYAIACALSEPNQKTLIIMETYPGIKMSMFLPIVDMLNRMDVVFESVQSVPLEIRFPNGHILRFVSTDKPGKAKYLDDIRRMIINEATEVKNENLKQLENRVGRTSKTAEFIYTFNPIDEHHPLIQRFVTFAPPYEKNRVDPDIAVLHTTYKDNWHNVTKYIRDLESSKDRDPNFYRVYALGEPGHLEGLIYDEGRNWEMKLLDDWPQSVTTRAPDRIGIDFGFNDPTVVMGVWEQEDKWYAHQYLYASDMTQEDLMLQLNHIFLSNQIPRDLQVYCDSAEPARIEDLRRGRVDRNIKGFNAQKSIKDIVLGIVRVKSKRLIVSSESEQTIKELRNYRWKLKEGSIKDEPQSGYLDHALDALRYAISTALGKNPIRRVVIEPAGQPYISPYGMRR